MPQDQNINEKMWVLDKSEAFACSPGSHRQEMSGEKYTTSLSQIGRTSSLHVHSRFLSSENTLGIGTHTGCGRTCGSAI